MKVQKSSTQIPQPSLSNFFSFLGKVFEGLCCGVAALVHSLPNKRMQYAYENLAYIFLATFVMMWIALLPWRILLLLFTLGQVEMPSTFELAVQSAPTLLPFALLVLRYTCWKSFEDVFFSELSGINNDLALSLRPVKPISIWDASVGSCSRQCRLMGMGLLLHIASSLPVVGPAVRTAGGVFLAVKLSGSLEIGLLIGLSDLIPNYGPYFQHLQHMMLTTRSLGREMLAPYLVRVSGELQCVPRLPNMPSPKAVDCTSGPVPFLLCHLSRKDMPFLMGSAAPFALIGCIPLIGPMALLLAQTGAAHIAVPMALNRRSIRYMN
eukprot:NODE_1237_length_1623_cov_31.212834_g1102_i0.p1 GENE.NODE_1237_length_1623_cov_31.212834_g1102_i0~~NODE_1237_length_1623_cov_31.212834_g1102_i0.p1  ORF type:complete len:323 (-),score=43.27 NODE_1237_length_1623_cov_31.212834_g1102_i0:576-1544(-)